MRDHTFDLVPDLKTQVDLFHAKEHLKLLQKRDALLVQALEGIATATTSYNTQMAEHIALVADIMSVAKAQERV